VKKYRYKEVHVQDTIATEAQNWSNQGWETAGIIPPAGLDLGFRLLVKQEIPRNPYDRVDSWNNWLAWETENHPDENPYDSTTQRDRWHEWEDEKIRREASA